MRAKPVPPAPDSLETLKDAQRAVPLVPGSVDDCCGRLQVEGVAGDRDEAAAWLEFLRALGLVAKVSRGYHRRRVEPDAVDLRGGFREYVFGAREVLAILQAEAKSADDDEPVTPLEAPAVFERFERHVPTWERQKSPHGWRDVWSRRVAALLEWAVLLDLAESRQGGYVVE